MTRRHRTGGTSREFPRTARLNHLLQEIVAEEIERIDDDRLGFLTIVGVEIEGDYRRATVWYTSWDADGDDAQSDLAEALEEARPRLQSAIARQARLKWTPELVLKPDPVARQAERVESILREITDEPD